MTLHYYRLFNVHVRTRNASGFSKYFNLLSKRNHFSSWHSLKGCHGACMCMWGEGGRWFWTSHEFFKKHHNLTVLFVAFTQAYFLSLLLLPVSLLQEMHLLNLHRFQQLFAQQVTSFVLLKFPLLNYDLNKVCMIKM